MINLTIKCKLNLKIEFLHLKYTKKNLKSKKMKSKKKIVYKTK